MQLLVKYLFRRGFIFGVLSQIWKNTFSFGTHIFCGILVILHSGKYSILNRKLGETKLISNFVEHIPLCYGSTEEKQ